MGTLSGTNGKSKPKKEVSNAPKFRFINHAFDKQQREDLAAMDVGVEFPTEVVDGLVAEGYKYSLSFDAGNQSFVASLTDRDDASAFYNVCLTGRGSTPSNARASLLYRHFNIAQGDWSALDQVPSSERPDFA